MQIQIALDRIPRADAVRIATAVAPYADVIEVGTSLVKAYGMAVVTEIAEQTHRPVLADLKTADDATTEFGMAFDAGAASATVLGLAAPTTVAACVRTAAERGREAVIDLMGLDARRCAELAASVPHEAVLAAHVPKDVQGAGASPTDLVGDWARGRRLALAGGLSAAHLPTLALLGQHLDLEWLRVIVGSAITKQPDPAAAARELTRQAKETQ
jgi:3-keto-L-gulonate-6-phosphate decarboxylase